MNCFVGSACRYAFVISLFLVEIRSPTIANIVFYVGSIEGRRQLGFYCAWGRFSDYQMSNTKKVLFTNQPSSMARLVFVSKFVFDL